MTIRIERPVTGPEDVLALERKAPWEEVLSAQSTYELIAGAAADRPEATAITFLATGDPDEEPVRITYRQLIGRITQAANLFHALGVGSDDVVSFLLPHLPQTHYAMWGAGAAGIANPINFLLQPDQIADLLNAARTRVLVALGPHPQLDIWQKVESVRRRVPSLAAVLQVGPGDPAAEVSSFDEAIAEQPADELVGGREIRRDDPAIFFHTGGTTGSPKLAPHTHGNDIYCAWAAAHMLSFTPETVMFNVLPMFHVAGAVVTGLAPLAAGGQVVTITPIGLRHPVALANHWKLVEKYQPTHIGGVPTNLAALMEVPSDEADLSSVKYAVTGGAALPSEIERAWNRRFARISQIYGMTEAGSTLVAAPVEGRAKPGSTGIRLPYGRWKIASLRPDGLPGDPCGPNVTPEGGKRNEVGAVMFKSPSVFPGYLDARHNPGTLTDDGWVITGDLGYIDDDHYLFLTGRSKDLIIRGAHNIDPAIIEEALAEHPAVALAAAVGKPDAYAGELPVAYVQLKVGSSASEGELLELAASRIAERPALPKEVNIVEALPVTGVGKIFKPALRWEQAERVFKEALAPLAETEGATIAVAVDEDRRRGTLARVRIAAPAAADRAGIEKEVGRLLGRYIVPHEVEWATAALAG
ncbi:MAG: acyl-CoA synthetase [bacterium]|nr:acyl-CoA synthetase [bacterium]